MDEIWLILNTFFAGYSFYAWKKYSDREFLWLGFLGVLMVFLLILKLYFLNSFSEYIKSILSIVIYYSWLPILAGLILLQFKARNTRYILLTVVLVLAIVASYLLFVGIDGVFLKP